MAVEVDVQGSTVNVTAGGSSPVQVNPTAGKPGKDGVGVPAGGTAGQALTKIDATDYNSEWTDNVGGDGSILRVIKVTQAEYNALAGSRNPAILYAIVG